MTSVGDIVPVLERTITLADMVAYAGATWDWHRLHYDPDYLAERGIPAPVVDGQVFGALLVEQLQDWLGPLAMVSRLHLRFADLVYAGETVRCVGTVTDVSHYTITVESRVEVIGVNARVAVAPAGAVIALRGVS